ncbi:hypothetical protein A5886_000968 [Enterococcus sp. 8G7_MSG3316]|uniref:Uncharacterized protein n=1 Tax=Candidatus Enterococcus testudinis TaxID=1834191 RepID=A0A242A4L3_9ENTE|nr:DUF916 and DUF3324 domain-containing protein [Enterococcus sp. 8G7_MSG3316]OTN75892.1 hypothetical protein A5886_000968 [Enterococcus sp. 8G7_MSG3316]
MMKLLRIPLVKVLLFIVCFIGGIVSFSQDVFANGELNFSVRAVPPATQFGDDKGYFDVELLPNESEDLVLVIRNVRDQPIDVKLTAHTAYTNVHGVVEYGADSEEPDPTLAHEMKDLLEPPSEAITFDAFEEKEVVVKLHMPKEDVTGLLVGGIKLVEETDDDQAEDSDSGMVVENTFSYVVGVVASNSRTQTITPELELLAVFADQLNYRNVFSANIQNFLPTFTNELSVEATVRLADSDEVLYEAAEEMMQMAPNSNFKFPIPLDGERFVSGTYVLDMTARSGKNEWRWEETFEVTADEARRLNRSDVSIEQTNWWWIVAGVAAAVVIISWLAYNTYKNKKLEKRSQEIDHDPLSEKKKS